MGHAVLMGRKTYESLGRPLPGRKNIVISRQRGLSLPAEVLARPNVVAASGANFRDLSRMFADLSELGVLALWDAELAAGRSASPEPAAAISA